jgi:hypothetical protein
MLAVLKDMADVFLMVHILGGHHLQHGVQVKKHIYQSMRDNRSINKDETGSERWQLQCLPKRRKTCNIRRVSSPKAQVIR